jgi:hypothetical protein
MRVVRNRDPLDRNDYAALERPAVHRQQRAVGDGLRPSEPLSEELLDIPAFLRRQAD